MARSGPLCRSGRNAGLRPPNLTRGDYYGARKNSGFICELNKRNAEFTCSGAVAEAAASEVTVHAEQGPLAEESRTVCSGIAENLNKWFML